MKKTMFLKVPNKLFSYKLKPSAFIIYIYLSSMFYWKKSIKIKLKTIAGKCNMSINTAQTAINQLTECGLLHKTKHYKNHKCTTNEYEITRLGGGFARVEKNILKVNIDNRAFMVLCYIYVCANHSLRAYPSLTQIQQATGLSRNTVIAKIRFLNELGLLYKQIRKKRGGSFGNNNHILIRLPIRVVLFWILNIWAERHDWLEMLMTAFIQSFQNVGQPRLRIFMYSLLAKLAVLFSFIEYYLLHLRCAYLNFCSSNFGKRSKDPLKYVKSEKRKVKKRNILKVN